MIEAGIYTDLSHAQYLADTDYVTASMLKRLLPEHYRPFTESPSANIGSVLHQRFTGEDVPVRVVDASTWVGKAAKDAYDAAEAAGEYAILTKDLTIVDGMEKALRDHREASRLLVDLPGTFETTVCADVDGVPSKCRFDKLADDNGQRIGVDIKTTKEPPNPADLAKAVIRLGYDLSTVHYTQVAEHAGIPLDGFVFVFVCNTAPFQVTVATLENEFMERGKALHELAVERHQFPDLVDAYPGQTNPVELVLPRWARL